jgi:hypothetical protein
VQHLDAPIARRRVSGASDRAVGRRVLGDRAIDPLGLTLDQITGKQELRFPHLPDARASVHQIGGANVIVDSPDRQVVIRHAVLARIRRGSCALDRQGLQCLEPGNAAERVSSLFNHLPLRRRRSTRGHENRRDEDEQSGDHPSRKEDDESLRSLRQCVRAAWRLRVKSLGTHCGANYTSRVMDRCGRVL